MAMTPIHGDAVSGQSCRLYNIWRGMRQRCCNPKATDYSDYGGRGITICLEWNDYSTFKNWALNHAYQENFSIERRDVDGDYSPDNCYWACNNIQASNKRKRSGKTSNFIGVAPNRFKWKAYVSYNKNRIELGTFSTDIEAAQARDDYIKKMGWPHKLNF